jgi:putative glutamine amidotransferase
MKPLIGISANISPRFDENRKISPDLALHHIQEYYIDFVANNGGIPLLLPSISTTEDVAELINRLDGVIITGGPDLDPVLYDEENRDARGVNALRDNYEIALAVESKRQAKPLLGICRGLQVMNVAYGGSLIQDIPTEVPGAHPHVRGADEVDNIHPIILVRESFLTPLYGSDEKVCNSSHHQSLKRLGEGLTLVAQSDDGIVEGVQDFSQFCLVGVQWHPERLQGTWPTQNPIGPYPPQVRLAKWFVQQVTEAMSRK